MYLFHLKLPGIHEIKNYAYVTACHANQCKVYDRGLRKTEKSVDNK